MRLPQHTGNKWITGASQIQPRIHIKIYDGTVRRIFLYPSILYMNPVDKSVVRISVQKQKYNWIHPWKKTDTAEPIGSGFFISENLILTCAHTLLEAIDIRMSTAVTGRQKYPLEIVYYCPDLDIALLRSLEFTSKYWLTLDDTPLKPGDRLKASGYPLASNTVKASEGMFSGYYEYFIQMGTPINPGNSGGPLLRDDLVIGINVQKMNNAENIGFALPIQLYLNQVKIINLEGKNQFLNIPTLGVILNDGTKTYQNYLQMQLPPSDCNFGTDAEETLIQGCVINYISKKSTMYQMGVRDGDLMTKFNGACIDFYGECFVEERGQRIHIKHLLKAFNLRDTINIEFYHLDTKEFQILEIDLSRNIHPYAIKTCYPKFERPEFVIFGGVVFMNLTSNHLQIIPMKAGNDTIATNTLRYQYSAPLREDSRVVVTSVLAKSNAQKDDLINVGDLVKTFGGKEIHTMKDLFEVLDNLKDRYIELVCDIKGRYIFDTELLRKEQINLAKMHGFVQLDQGNE